MSGQPTSREILVSVGVGAAVAAFVYYAYRRQTSGLEPDLDVCSVEGASERVVYKESSVEDSDEPFKQSSIEPVSAGRGKKNQPRADNSCLHNKDVKAELSDNENVPGCETSSPFSKSEKLVTIGSGSKQEDVAETKAQSSLLSKNESKLLLSESSPRIHEGTQPSNVARKEDVTIKQIVPSAESILTHDKNLNQRSPKDTDNFLKLEKSAETAATQRATSTCSKINNHDNQCDVVSPQSDGDTQERSEQKPKLVITPKGDNEQGLLDTGKGTYGISKSISDVIEVDDDNQSTPDYDKEANVQYSRSSRLYSYSSQQSLETDTAPMTPNGRQPNLYCDLEPFSETFHGQTSIMSSDLSILNLREDDTQSGNLITIEEELSPTGTSECELQSQPFHNIQTPFSPKQIPIMQPQTSDIKDHRLPESMQTNLNTLSSNNQNLNTTLRPCNLGQLSDQAEGRTVTVENERSADVSVSTSDYGSLASSTDNMSNSNLVTPEGQPCSRLPSVPQSDAEPYLSSSKGQGNIETISDLEEDNDICDGVILHADTDRDGALEFINNMKGQFPDLELNLLIYEELNIGKSMFGCASELFKTCRYLFVFISDDFLREDLVKFLNEIFLIATITEEEKCFRLIPTMKDNVHIAELGPIIPLKYHRFLEAKSQNKTDQAFIRGFKRLICDGRKKFLSDK